MDYEEYLITAGRLCRRPMALPDRILAQLCRSAHTNPEILFRAHRELWARGLLRANPRRPVSQLEPWRYVGSGYLPEKTKLMRDYPEGVVSPRIHTIPKGPRK